LAIPFRSYLQPFIIMAVVPFGVAGAVLGHFLTLQSLSMLSLLGIIALSGVVVNDSLVLVDYINRRRSHGITLQDAVHEAGIVRFRPILLTSLTTFMGLVPILLERSLQAQFLIPMATSLGFGVLFATFITLLMVPAVYLVLEDFKRFLARWFGLLKLGED
jgi:multidrug efflux pump subunit AcrB